MTEDKNSEERLVQDDFDWGGINPQPSFEDSSAIDQPTELDRIEFEHISKDKPKEEPKPPLGEAEKPMEEERVYEKPIGGWRDLIRYPKMYIIAAAVLVPLVVCSGMLWHLYKTKKSVEAPQVLSGNPIITLGPFVVVSEKDKSKNFLSFSVTLTVADELFEFFQSQEPLVRGEIYQILKEIEKNEDLSVFYNQVRERVNARFGCDLIIAASATLLESTATPQ
jgi:flagellar basal body-associated protein FliL